jgi:two-component system chemotaxis response regulator CheY
MRILIVEDDFANRLLLQRILSPYGDCDVAVNGKEAMEAFDLAWDEGQPYQLILLDIVMPEMSGQEALRQIREKEREVGIQGADLVKTIMTTGVVDSKNLKDAFMEGCCAYLVKPIEKNKLLSEIKKLGLV